jgi:hypothetical protein
MSKLLKKQIIEHFEDGHKESTIIDYGNNTFVRSTNAFADIKVTSQNFISETCDLNQEKLKIKEMLNDAFCEEGQFLKIGDVDRFLRSDILAIQLIHDFDKKLHLIEISFKDSGKYFLMKFPFGYFAEK